MAVWDVRHNRVFPDQVGHSFRCERPLIPEWAATHPLYLGAAQVSGRRLTDMVSNAQLEKLNLEIRSLHKKGNRERSMPL